MFGLKLSSWFRRRDREGEAAVDRLAQQLAAESLRRHGWLDAGVWGPSLFAAEARKTLLHHVSVTGDE